MSRRKGNLKHAYRSTHIFLYAILLAYIMHSLCLPLQDLNLHYRDHNVPEFHYNFP